MKYELIITALAQQDVEEILEYYHVKAPQIVNKFLENLDSSIQSIKANPEKMQKRFANVRFMPITKFDYSIHYYLDLKAYKIVITAVLHSKRNTDLWLKRK